MTTTIVYRCPGPNLITGSLSYDTKGIDVDDLKEALSQGWFESVPDAIAAFQKPSVKEPAKDEDQETSMRDELLKKAEELGIDVDRRWGDKRLMAEIEEALAKLPKD